jgi:ribonuclease Z
LKSFDGFNAHHEGVASFDGLELHLLGTGAALPTAARDTTGLLVRGPDGWSLIDCPGAIVHKLARLGLRPADLRRLLITHDHVDHIYGLAHLLHAIAVAGVPDALEIHAPPAALERVEAIVAAHGLEGDRYPRLGLRPIEMEEGFEVVAGDGLRILAAPTAHGRDTAALRLEAGGASLCHSSDTRPCDAVAALAREAGLLLHDCGGPHRLRDDFAANHSSAREAGDIAAAAGVARLVLVHLGVAEEALLAECLEEARAAFEGPVELGCDGDRYALAGRGGAR